MSNNDMTWLQRVETMKSILDYLPDAKGVQRCKYICMLDELLDEIRNDGLIMEEKINDFEKLYKEGPSIQNGTEI